jgi:hypothetical protein
MGSLLLYKTLRRQHIRKTTLLTEILGLGSRHPFLLVAILACVAPALTCMVTSRNIQMLTYKMFFHSVYMYRIGLRQ